VSGVSQKEPLDRELVAPITAEFPQQASGDNGIHHCAFEFDSFDDLMNQQQQREISARRNRRRT
jgi:hypothetical protein